MSQSKDTTLGDIIQLLSDVCRQAGLKLTRRQLEAFRKIADCEEGATAGQINSRLRTRLPALSREALRKTLSELQRAGVVREVDDSDESARPVGKASPGLASPERKGARTTGFPASGDERTKQILFPGKAGEYRC